MVLARATVNLSRSEKTQLSGGAQVMGIGLDNLPIGCNTVRAMGETSDARIQALSVLNLALRGKQVYGNLGIAGDWLNGTPDGRLSYGMNDVDPASIEGPR